MSRLTLRLPESLHQQLEMLAHQEKTSLNQFIVYSLTRQVAATYTVRAVPPEEIERQRMRFDALLDRLGPASPADVEAALAARPQAEAEPDLNPESVRRLQARIAAQSTKN